MIEVKMLGNKEASFLLNGVIGEDFNVVDIQGIVEASMNYDKVIIQLNSPGGSVVDGWAMYNILQKIKNKLEIEVIGLGASMASILALSGKSLKMRQGSFLMIHNPWTIAIGSASDMRATADVMDTMKEDIVKVYESRSYLNNEEIKKMMEEETWIEAEKALDYGFANSVDTISAPIFNKITKVHFNNIPNKITNRVEATTEINKKNNEEIEMDNEKMIDEISKVKNELKNELTNEIMAKLPAGRSIDENETKVNKDQWFYDYLASKGTLDVKNATITTNDGFAIPKEASTEVFRGRDLGSFMRKSYEGLGLSNARIRKYSGDTEVSVRKNPSAKFIPEGGVYPNNTDLGSRILFKSKKLASTFSITEECAEDTVVNVWDNFQLDMAKAIVDEENEKFIKGDGINDPEGMLIGGTQVSGITGVSTTGITYDALIDFDEKLPEEYRDGAFYMMHSSTRAILRKLKDSSNRPLLQEYINGRFFLFGKPIIENKYLDSFGANKKVILLGNREGYGIGDRTSGLKLATYTDNDTANHCYRWCVRLDGKVIDPTAFQVLNTPAS